MAVQKKENFEILILLNDKKLVDTIVTYIRESLYTVHIFSSSDELLNHISEIGEGILIFHYKDKDETGNSLCRVIRTQHFSLPLQILLYTDEGEEIAEAIEHGGDDFFTQPITRLSFQARIKAAVIRHRMQKKIYQEREFFRQAVRQEEELTSKILDQHLQLKEAFQNIESINSDLKKSNAHLERIAKFDVLSGLLNRMTLFGIIDSEIERAIRSGLPLSGAMIDIDKFKSINDNFGHPCGDEAIKILGQVLHRTLRKYDYAGRYGGEEFFIVLPNSTAEQAFQIAERFRKELELNEELRQENEIIKLTVSIGVAQFMAGETREMWIARCDKAMYKAKQRGKNQVTMF